MIRIKNNFDFKSTITCGQIFRYSIELNTYTIVLNDRIISIEEDGDYLNIESNNENNLKEIINNYFSLDIDYNKINNILLKRNPSLKEIINFNKDIKIIRQNPFETLISYMISQNNRVFSIMKSIDLISEKYGKEILYKNKKYYLFPSIDSLKNVGISDFRECKLGFRDKYIYNIINEIINKNLDLDVIKGMTSVEALKYLTKFNGIGNKVASCILLFAYERYDVFPIDTWVKKYMLQNYGLKNLNEISIFATEKFSLYSALVIQYIFNYSRNKK